MKAAPEGVAMKHAARAADACHLQRLRRLTNWPLGESGVYARLEWLATRPSLHDCDDETRFQHLIENLGDMYAAIHSTFDEFRPPFDSMDSQRPQHPKAVRRAAKMHFFELLTTTRFAVEDMPRVGEIIARELNPCQPLELRHSIALAALVCLKNALESLEEIADSQAAEMSRVLIDAADSSDQAKSWLAHFESMNVVSGEMNREVRNARAETAQQLKAETSRKNARPGYRVAKDLTPEVIASYFNERPGQKYEPLIVELADLYGASRETVSRRYSQAKKNNLLS